MESTTTSMAPHSPVPPSLEEFLILMHLFAAIDCDFYHHHIDENRAILNAPKLGQIRTIASIPGDPA